jgi:FkbM family methyltransferase
MATSSPSATSHPILLVSSELEPIRSSGSNQYGKRKNVTAFHAPGEETMSSPGPFSWLPSLYQLKKLVLMPYTLYMRHRERETSGFIRSALELHYYRPTFYEFIGATVSKPDILHDHALDEHSVVLDVGAYVGDWSQAVSERYSPRIFAFEPNPHSFKLLEEKAAIFPGLFPQFYGLGDRTEDLTISIRGLGSSLFESRDVDRESSRASARVVDIDEAWKNLGLDRVDFMKINIEGAEFPLLERMIECKLLDRVDSYLIQFHEWHPGAYRRRNRIRRELLKTHKLEWDYHFVWEKWSRR